MFGRSLGEFTEHDMTDAEPSVAPRSLVNGRLDPRLLAMVVDFAYHIAEQAPHLFALPANKGSDKGTAVSMPTLISQPAPAHGTSSLPRVQWSTSVLAS